MITLTQNLCSGLSNIVPGWPENGFRTIDDARVWVNRFVNWYNFEHKHSGIKYVTPAERHQGNDMKILAARKAVYQLAREQHPERWRKHLRNWDYISEVYLNPEKRLHNVILLQKATTTLKNAVTHRSPSR